MTLPPPDPKKLEQLAKVAKTLDKSLSKDERDARKLKNFYAKDKPNG